ncbi:MAG: biopolymer transporter ExbD [bacterium]|nr:biopolymer transporter ExbD [bacterium]
MADTSTSAQNETEPDEAFIAPPRRKRKADDEMDITPMIDITFLLLIFFLVTSKMSESTPVDVPITEFGENVPAKNCVVITVANSGGEMADVFLGSGKAPGTQADGDRDTQREAIVEYIVNDIVGSPNKNMVIIMGEKRLKQGEVNRVSQAVTEANGQLAERGIGEIVQILLAVRQQ